MKKKLIISVSLVLLVLFALSFTVLAHSYDKTNTNVAAEDAAKSPEPAFNTPPEAAIRFANENLDWAVGIMQSGFNAEDMCLEDISDLNSARLSQVYMRLNTLDYSKLNGNTTSLVDCIKEDGVPVWRFTIEVSGFPVAYLDVCSDGTTAEFAGISSVGGHCAAAQKKLLELCGDNWERDMRLIFDGIYLNYVVLSGNDEYVLSELYLSGADDYFVNSLPHPDPAFVSSCREAYIAAAEAKTLSELPSADPLISWYLGIK